jgi:Sodium/calcium exchanger protein.
LKIPDSVLGLTFLAAGMSIPEVVSSVIVTKQGKDKAMTSWLTNLLPSFN